MTRDRSSSIASFLVLGQIFCVISAQQCTEQYSIYGTMLKKHIFKRTEASDWSTCVQACEDDLICQSMNYVISKKNCELNNRTKEARPEDFVPNDKRWYMTRLNKRGIMSPYCLSCHKNLSKFIKAHLKGDSLEIKVDVINFP